MAAGVVVALHVRLPPVALAAAVAVGGLRVRRSLVALAVAGLCGSVLGSFESAAQEGSCLRTLGTGTSVEVHGQVAARPGAMAGGRLRMRLREAVVHTAEGSCRAGRILPVRVRADGGRPRRSVRTGWVRPGDRVALVGQWRAWSTGRGEVEGHVVRHEVFADVPLGLRLRRRAGERLAGRLSDDVAATALALVLAERDEIAPELRRRFVSAGMAHLLAISGLHVGMIAAALVVLLRRFTGRAASHGAALAVVAFYVALIGAPVSAVRALFVVAGYAWAAFRGWPARPGELLGLALLGTLLIAPESVAEPGLQLSFAGFAGVLVGGRLGMHFRPGSGRAARWVRSVAAGAAAVAATSPITAYHFGQVTPSSLPAHLFAAPLVAVALPAVFATLAVPAPVAFLPAAAAAGAIRALHLVADVFARMPGGMHAVAPPSVAIWLAWLLLVVAAMRVLRTGRVARAAVPVCLSVGLFTLAPLPALRRHDASLLCTLSVGQGDAAVLRTLRGRWLVFDGGPVGRSWNAGQRVVAPFIRRHGGGAVDLIVLSHPDLDHLGGLAHLLEEFPVRGILDTGHPVPSEAYARFLDRVESTGTPWRAVRAGDRFSLDEAELLVLGPGEGRESDVNATSLSFRLTIGGFRYVNTGDAGHEEESSLLGIWPTDTLRADLLKVGHHGSRGSTGSDWLAATRPTLAVISAGAGNRYGHPHPLTVARLRLAGVEVWRTDRFGTLCVEVEATGRWRIKGDDSWRAPTP